MAALAACLLVLFLSVSIAQRGELVLLLPLQLVFVACWRAWHSVRQHEEESAVIRSHHHLSVPEQQQAAEEENALMARAPCEACVEAASADRARATDGVKAVVAALCTDGVTCLRDVLGRDQAHGLLLHVNHKLSQAVAADAADAVGATAEPLFGDVLGRLNRYDLKLHISEVRTALEAVAQVVGPSISRMLGSQAVLYELGALVADPGAPRQQVHPDTDWSPEAAAISCFVALQDIDETMGPTIFLPRTHTEVVHDVYHSTDAADMQDLLRHAPYRVALLRAGDCALFDSRLLHCASANVTHRRVVFYFSLRSRSAAPPPPGTLFHQLQERYVLNHEAGGLLDAPGLVQEPWMWLWKRKAKCAVRVAASTLRLLRS